MHTHLVHDIQHVYSNMCRYIHLSQCVLTTSRKVLKAADSDFNFSRHWRDCR